MFGIDNTGSVLDTVVHIIQVSLSPVFLLSGIATLLNVFSTRLARVADQVDAVAKELEGAGPARARVLSRRLTHLHRRSLALDVAVVLGAVGGAATCGAVLILFLGALREATVASLLFGLFGLAVVCALGAIAAFTVEMLIASMGLRDRASRSRHNHRLREDARRGRTKDVMSEPDDASELPCEPGAAADGDRSGKG